jgi:hypothetical protein
MFLRAVDFAVFWDLFWGARVASLPSEIQGFFPFGFAQGQNDGKGKSNGKDRSRSLRDDKQEKQQQLQGLVG